MIKHIIFDFFGVIVDSGHVDEQQIWADLLDIDEQKLRDVISMYRDEINRGVMSIPDFWKHIEEDLNIKIDEDPNGLFYKTLESVVLYKKVWDYISELKSRGYTCTLLSDVFEPDFERVDKKGRYDIFDDLVLSCKTGLSKLFDHKNNTHKIFDYALKKYELSPDEVIFIDDNIVNCETANRAGIKAIQAKNEEQIVKDIELLLASE